MEDVRDLKESQLDAIREVANIGAGHAATALSGMTDRTIMITVPRVYVRPLEEACDLVGEPDSVVAAVLMHMMGDLTGRALVLFPQRAAHTLCDFLFRRPMGSTTELGEMEQSGLKEAGTIGITHSVWRHPSGWRERVTRWEAISCCCPTSPPCGPSSTLFAFPSTM